MSKKKETSKGIENVEETLTKTEQFLEENYKPLLYSLVVIVALVGIFWLLRLYVAKQNKEAMSQMYMAEQYFDQDSLKLALYGDGNNLGFIDVADQYKRTKSGMLANLYAGVSLMHLSQYDEAVTYLKKFKVKDEILAPEAKALLGDASVENGDNEEGIRLYLEAADMADNNFHSPVFLMKAGMMYEIEGKYSDALTVYEKIKDKYPESTEGRSIDKYIARVKLHIN